MKLFYFILALTTLFDLAVLPILGFAQTPYFLISLLPSVFLLMPRREVAVSIFLSVIIFWPATEVNLGIITFSLGIMLFFVRWFVPRVFQKNTWQAVSFSSLGIIIFGALIASLTFFLIPENNLFSGIFITNILLSVPLSILLGLVINKTFHEKKII